MLFNSWEFAVFFLAVLAVYAITARRVQNLLLLFASYFFYGWWDWRFLGLVLLSTVVDYTLARQLEGTDEETRRRRLVTISVVVNLGILGIFKYYDFFVGSAVLALQSAGLDPHPPALHIILPVGISFYTFQTMAYTIDVYRRKQKAVKNFTLFALYVCYFPQLVAGPIERPQNLLPQFDRDRKVSWEQLSSGAFLVFMGLVRKVGIADVVAPVVDQIFENPAEHGSIELLVGVFLFAIQIYCDFSGYSAIARGTSRMLGIELMENFRQPYFSTNITVFWRRWHISLSTWLRDYLYIPLGGNRGGKFRTYRNLALTMLLGGLWHGASWNFVVWGAIHGGALAIHKLITGNQKILDNPKVEGPLGFLKALGGWLITMLVVMFAWIFFRSPNFANATSVISGIATGRGAWPAEDLWFLGQMLVWMLILDVPNYRTNNQTRILEWHWAIRGVLYAVFVMLMILAERDPDATFIYFQF